MFTRTSSVEPTKFDPRPSKPPAPNPVQRRTGPVEAGKSVIGNDLKIIGQGLKIISQGVLQVDGEIGGDVRATEVIVGEQGMVTGMVAGNQVVVLGKVSGVICGKTVALHASSHIEGDIHHMSFSIELGARFEGRSRRLGSDADLNALIDERALA
jgi:cytoskeletal protein CcmA (bactofilin family)